MNPDSFGGDTDNDNGLSATGDLTGLLSTYNELSESREVSPTANSTRLWKLLLALLVVTLAMFGASTGVCFSDPVCRGTLPTMHTLLNSALASPFLLLGVVAATLAHGLTAMGLYYRCVQRARGWSRLQLAWAALLYASMLVSLLVFPFTSWPKNWANLGSVVCLGIWMICVQCALFATLRDRISRQRRLLKGSLVVLVGYLVVSAAYVTLRAVPAAAYMDGLYAKHLGLMISEMAWGITLIVYMVLSVLHVRRMNFSVYLADAKGD